MWSTASKIGSVVSIGVCVVVLLDCVGDSTSNPPSADAGGSDSASDTGAADAPNLLDGSADSATDAGACDLTKPFGTPTPVPGMIGDSVWYDTNELSAYSTVFLTDGGAGPIYAIETLSRPNTSAGFGNPVVSELNQLPNENGKRATLTDDGKIVVFSSYRAGSGSDLQLFSSTRASTLAPFPTPTKVANVSAGTGYSDGNASISPNAEELYFDSNRGTTFDIYVATGSSGPTFSAALKVALGSGNATAPVISHDRRSLYFGTSRVGGKLQIWVAKRSTPQDGFGAPAPVDELNVSGADQYPTWISPDECRIYFTRRNPSASTFVARRP